MVMGTSRAGRGQERGQGGGGGGGEGAEGKEGEREGRREKCQHNLLFSFIELREMLDITTDTFHHTTYNQDPYTRPITTPMDHTHIATVHVHA